jgi:hypothetical protein
MNQAQLMSGKVKLRNHLLNGDGEGFDQYDTRPQSAVPGGVNQTNGLPNNAIPTSHQPNGFPQQNRPQGASNPNQNGFRQNSFTSQSNLRQNSLTGQNVYYQQNSQSDQINPRTNSITTSLHQPYNTSYDMITPPVASNSNSRKASLTSQSGLNRFFQRNKSHNDNFDDDIGADIGELTNGLDVSLKDITHIRDRGAYAMTAKNRSEDSTPIIPTIGMVSGKPTSNIQYRKQMNQQMKLAYSNGPRATTMNHQQNPMNNGRTMSFNSFGGQGPRTMSLMSGGNPPRTMSMNNNGYTNDPRTMSMNSQQYPVNNVFPPNGGPRSMSMRSGNMPLGAPRTMSLNSQQQLHPGNGGYPNQYPPHLQKQYYQQSNQQMGMNPPRNNMHQPQDQFNQQQQFYQQGQKFPPGHSNSSDQLLDRGSPVHGKNTSPSTAYSGVGYTSNDSLTNVPEEEEEELIRKSTLAPQRKAPPLSDYAAFKTHETSEHESKLVRKKSDEVNDEVNDEDAIYKFENEDEEEALSRKSTLKKTNSMRLRKLDLFNKKRDHMEETKEIQEEGREVAYTAEDNETEKTDEITTSPSRTQTNEPKNSPSFNARNSGTRYSTYTTDNDDEDHRNKTNYRSLGASAQNKSNSTTMTNDVFVTAPDFNSPVKNYIHGSNMHIRHPSNQSSISKSYTDEDNALTIKRRGSPQSSINHLNAKTMNPVDTNRNDDDSTPVFQAPNQFEPPKQFDDSSSNGHSPSSLNFEQPINYPYSVDSLPNSTHSGTASIYSSHTGTEPTQPDCTDSIRENSANFKSRSAQDEIDTVAGNYTHSQGYVSHMDEGSHNYETQFKNNIRPSSIDYANTRSTSTYSESQEVPRIQSSTNSTAEQKSKRDSRSSITSKSKNLLKRFSKSGRRSSQTIDNGDEKSLKLDRNSYLGHSYENNTGSRDVSSSSFALNNSQSQQKMPYKPLHFSKEELGIMNCNNDLLAELELVSTELASSIKRELSLENKLKNSSYGTGKTNLASEVELSNKAKIVSDLQEKLNKERRLRFISEEHALMLEHGQEPSALKINYEKNEIYKQLLMKNDLVNQLEDKLSEYENKNKSGEQDLLDKYNELLKENTDLKFRIVPELERKFRDSERRKIDSMNRSMSLVGNDSFDQSYDESHEQIVTLKHQREELRETMSKLTQSHNYEMKQAAERARALEEKLRIMKSINDKLTNRNTQNDADQGEYNENGNFSTGASKQKLPMYNKGGKLQKLSIVTPTTNFFD